MSDAFLVLHSDLFERLEELAVIRDPKRRLALVAFLAVHGQGRIGLARFLAGRRRGCHVLRTHWRGCRWLARLPIIRTLGRFGLAFFGTLTIVILGLCR